MKVREVKNLFPKLLKFVRPHKRSFFLSVIFSLIAIVLNMLIPMFSGFAIDTMIGVGNVNFHLLFEYLVLIGVLTVASTIFEWLGDFYMNILTYRTSQSIRSGIYKKLNRFDTSEEERE